MSALESRIVRPAVLAAATLALAACGAAQRLADVGKAPALTHIETPANQPGYVPVSLPMPAPQLVERQPNSLWRSGARAFFRDQRAKDVGDILTVLIEISDRAEIQNETARTRANSEGAELPALLGYEQALGAVLPEAIDPSSLVELGSDSSSRGTGTIRRGETIELKVAAIVTQVLPNGNLVVHGRQEVRVNFEVRELQIAGVIRPEDITSENAISYEKIAEARVSYGGRGQITDVQQPRYGQQVLDILLPF